LSLSSPTARPKNLAHLIVLLLLFLPEIFRITVISLQELKVILHSCASLGGSKIVHHFRQQSQHKPQFNDTKARQHIDGTLNPATAAKASSTDGMEAHFRQASRVVVCHGVCGNPPLLS
jgi:hypothetical protein